MTGGGCHETARPVAVGASPSTLSYRPDIDGLRAVAVLAVLFYHANIAPVSGGFVGVDVFFVISGYLIMSVLDGEIRQGRFSIVAFYERRIRRIFPALFVMAAACLVAAGLLFPPASFAALGKSLLAMTAFASNILFCFDHPPEAGYFAAPSEAQLLLHTWSLAVEEQFYIFLPLGLVWLRRFSQGTTAAVLAIIAAASFAANMWAVAHWPLGDFYLVMFRAWELLLGSLLATRVLPPLARRWLRESAAAAGLGMILLAIFAFNRSTAFPGAAALLPCVGACLVIHAGIAPTLVGRALGSRIPVAIGLISYSLYLWHWPLIVLVKQLDTAELTATAKAFVILASFAAAALSTRFVERPFRGRRALMTRRQIFVGALATSLVTCSAAVALIASDGLPGRYDARTRDLIAANVEREGDRPSHGCSNYLTPVQRIADITFCTVGRHEPRKVLFWGDSVVDALVPVVQHLYDEKALGGRSAVFATSAGCLPSRRLNRPGTEFHCADFSRLVLQRAEMDDVDTVFIAFSAWWDVVDRAQCLAEDQQCNIKLPHRQIEKLFVADVGDSITALRQRGKKVILSLPGPDYNMELPALEINDAILGRGYPALRDIGLVRRLKRNDHPWLRRAFSDMAETQPGLGLFDPLESLCRGTTCIYEKDGVSIYTDALHVADSQIGIFHDGLRRALAQP